MNRTRKLIIMLASVGLAVGLVAAVVPQPGLSYPAAAAADTYKIDPVHSMVIFKIGHMGVSNSYGRFNEISGEFSLDESNPSNGSFSVEVKTESIDTNNENRDKHLKSPDFFNARQYPAIAFKSTKVTGSADGSFEVTGDLTLHGVTNSITIPVTKIGAGKGRQGEALIGLETSLKLKRSDYGMRNMLDMVGDEVTLRVALEAARK